MVNREYNYHFGYVTGCLGYKKDYITQLCGDYLINHEGSLLTNQDSMKSKRMFFVRACGVCLGGIEMNI